MRKRLKVGIVLVLILSSIVGYYFINHNDTNYNKTIAEVISIETSGGNDSLTQTITATLMNGSYKGQTITLTNETNRSQIIDPLYKIHDKIFVKLQTDQNNHITSATIQQDKRDVSLLYIVILFILLMIIIGGLKGFKSIISLLINILIFLVMLKLNTLGFNLYLLSIFASLIFIITSLLLVSGFNKKTYSAILGSIVSIIVTLLITFGLFAIDHSQSINFEHMEFLITSPKQIFFVELLIGILGGIMDIAITMSSSIFELYDQNPDIDTDTLEESSTEIGNDVMGTMANTLVFTYLSGSIPMLLLWFGNGVSLSYLLEYGINLEIIRALTGSIGVVLSIPITISITIFLLKKHKLGVN